jgi:superfamily II DNA or RNA helicase
MKMKKANLNKDEEQQAHLELWKKSGCKGTSIAVTGLGKTRMGLLAIAETLEDHPDRRALVIVPTENLRDNEWINEFYAWNLMHLLGQVEFECIQTAYKMSNRHWNVVVIDEIHTTLSPEYRKFYHNNTWNRIYGLTATVPENEEYKILLGKIAPIIYTTNTKDALNLGLISPYKVFNLGISFTAEEAKAYNKIDSMYNAAVSKLGGIFEAFRNATLYKNKGNSEQKKWANIFYVMMQKRKQLCYNAHNKIKTIKQIIEKFPDRKGLVFSESIDFAEGVQEAIGDECVTFHSKLKASDRKTVLTAFSSGYKRIISSVKALNVGFNVPDCSLGICAAGSSKALDNIQRRGRTVRMQEGKTAIYVNLYVKGSQEVKWVRKRTQSDFNTQWVDSIDDIKLE